MIRLEDRVKIGLDEARILVLGAQVLLGSQYRSVMEKGFERLPPVTQELEIAGLALMIVAVGLLMAPAAYHRLVLKGESTPGFLSFIAQVMAFALLPFALGMGIDVFAATQKLSGIAPAVSAGFLTFLTALFFWYFLGLSHRPRHRVPEAAPGGGVPLPVEGSPMKQGREPEELGERKLYEKINHALTETRVVLPGAQALLGFQFAAMLAEGFDKLPSSSRLIHMASLALITIAVILLITPAAYHRIAEEGEFTEHFHRFTGHVLLAAMAPLALGMTGDFYVVARKVFHSDALSLGLAVALLLFFGVTWFGLSLFHRAEHRPAAGVTAREAG